MDKKKLIFAASILLNVILINEHRKFSHDFGLMAKLLKERDAIIEQARDICTAKLFEDIVRNNPDL